jgi:hypothetical protein
VNDAPAERGAWWGALRRRKVVQWTVAYAAGAWLLLQVLGFAVDTYGWPSIVAQLAMLGLTLGLPVVATLAWFHGERSQQRVCNCDLCIDRRAALRKDERGSKRTSRRPTQARSLTLCRKKEEAPMATRRLPIKTVVPIPALILVGCLLVYVQQSGAAQQAAAPIVRDVIGAYEGSYTCGQGNTRFRLEVRSDDDRVLTAVFTFFLPAGSPNPTSSHAFRLQGPINANGETQLTPRAWETTPPAGWSMVGMTGRFDTGAGTFSGRIQGPGCTTYSSSRAASQTLTTGNAQSRPGQQSPRVDGAATGTAAASRPNTPQPASSSAPQQHTAATQAPTAVQEEVSDPLAESRANCETDIVLMNFYDCACYAQRTVEVLNQSRVVRPPPYVPDGPPTTAKADNPKLVEYVAALSRYNEAVGKAREAAATTTACISASAISKWVHQQVDHLNLPGRPPIGGDCVAEAVTRQYQRNPNPNSNYVQGLLSQAAPPCQR